MFETYTGKILSLAENDVYVFGSNTEGRHGKGSALIALEKFGAVYGQSEGMQGQSYAICTKDLTKKVHPSVEKYKILQQIETLYFKASNEWSYKKFWVVYAGTGTNYNAYSPKEMAEMFSAYPIPNNFLFEEEFSKLFKY